MIDWQPIETASRDQWKSDGFILLWDDGEALIGCWSHEHGSFIADVPIEREGACLIPNPTHWAPIQPPADWGSAGK